MMSERIKILVCCHKPDVYHADSVYMPIHVGKHHSKYALEMQGDDTGENISEKNESYCELTGIYWAWKNLKDIDYIGLCHYRRYFNFHESAGLYVGHTIIKTDELKAVNLEIPVLDKIFKKHRVILTEPSFFKYSIFIQYSMSHISDDYRTLTAVIKELYPDYSMDWEILSRASNKICFYNMFIMKKEDFDSYCKWLFDILFEVEKRIDISCYNNIQKRVFGYLGERLLQLYVSHNKMNTKYYPIYTVNDVLKNKNFVKRLFKRIGCNMYAFPYKMKKWGYALKNWK